MALPPPRSRSSTPSSSAACGRATTCSARTRPGFSVSSSARSARGYIAPSRDVVASIDQAVAQIDQLLTGQLNEIMHTAEFQKLESTWRGLFYLVDKSETGETLSIRVLNASKKDLLDDLTKAVEFDQSGLFKKIYEDEFGTPGGKPFGCLIGDYEFGKHPQDFLLLEKMSNVAAAAFAPFMAAAGRRCSAWTATPSCSSHATSR